MEVAGPDVDDEDFEDDIHEDKTTNINPWKVRVKCYGERFRVISEGGKHTQGTEIKAITMHEMRIFQNAEEGGRWEVYVLVDI
eukprot:g10783.t1